MKLQRSSVRLILSAVIACTMDINLPIANSADAPKDRAHQQTSPIKGKVKRTAGQLRPADHGIGRFIADTAFLDLDGTPHSLGEFRKHKLLVVAMTSTSCPLSRRYLPTLTKLAKEYADKDVKFLAVNCVPTDKRPAMQTAAKAFGTAALYVHDSNEQLARQTGALTTTDVVVLDSARTVVYHGAIDDQYGIGYALETPRQTFLVDAIDALLAGEAPAVTATAAPGCLLNHETPDIATVTDITYHNRVSRIIQQNCIECHRGGGVGPFPLDTYSDVTAHAPMIRDVVSRGTMPPWFATKPAEGHDSIWANDSSLSEADKTDLTAWIEGGRPEGDPNDAPVARKFVEGWTLGKPDYVVQIPEPIKIKATGIMKYQNVATQTTLTEDTWIKGYEIVPTDRSVVHHVLVNVKEKGSGRILNREEGVGGYWAAYVPGNVGQLFPPGFGKMLPAGSTVTFQIHYTPNGEATQDQLKIGFFFAEEEPDYVITTIPLTDMDLNIPPQAENHVESIVRPVPSDLRVLAYMPHMHVRGKAFKYELLTPDGQTRNAAGYSGIRFQLADQI